MRLSSFSVEKYRSITTAKKIVLTTNTVLVGPNNEGKSNLLRALVTAMRILTRERYGGSTRHRRTSGVLYRQEIYNWDLDFPIRHQIKNPQGRSVMTLEFELTPDELTEFRETIGSRLTGTLPIRVSIGPDRAEVAVAKQGQGAKTLSKKSDQIAEFVTDRIDLQHIEAVRTAQSANEVVAEMVGRELYALESDPAYREALARLDELQQPILNELSETIKGTLRQFIGNITEVKIEVPSAARFRAVRRSAEITIDDGTPTRLEYKGDGVQSLAALGLIRHATERSAAGKNTVIAIEEPESHLHPNAIHQLREVIASLSARHQIILTTHNPLFVDRRNIENNVIVRSNRAISAKRVSQVREALGVRASDNLQHAELVLVVEGETDRMIVGAVLAAHSEMLASAMSSGSIAIDTLAGGSNLPYKLASLRSAICRYHAFLDDDEAGRTPYEKARQQGLITESEIHFAMREEAADSELEDLIDKKLYSSTIFERYGVSLANPKFAGKGKWSDRLERCFRNSAKQWSKQIETAIKTLVAESVVADASSAVPQGRFGPFRELISALEASYSSSDSDH